MKYLAAYALLTLSGKKDITAEDIKSVLGSVQCKADDAQIKSLLANLKGKSVHQLIADGQKRLGGSSAPVADSKAAGKKQQPKKKEQPKKKQEPKKKEQPIPEPEQEQDLGGLFD